MKTSLRPRANSFIDTYAITNSFWKQVFSGNQSDLREKKSVDQQVIHRLDLLKNNLPENTAQSAKQNIVIKNGNEGKY